MTTQNDGIVILLANRTYLYTLLQRLFGDEPSLEVLEIATNEHTKESLLLIQDEENPLFAKFIDNFADIKEQLLTDADEILSKLKSEYTALLIGPNKLPAPPWESVYTTKERTLFQESTLKVRRSYLEYQFLPAKYPHEADDHIALELDFMAHLAGLTQKAFEEEKLEDAKKLLQDQKKFLEDHMLVWIGDFAKDIQQGKTNILYPKMAQLTDQFLKTDQVLVEEMISLM